MDKYKISVIIPCYNSAKYIKRCIMSVLNQSYKNIEIIVSDDGSVDDTKKIVSSLMKKYKNIIYTYHENVGLAITRNLGVEHATGDYITYLDSDDYFHPDYFKENIDNSINYDIVITSYTRVLESENEDKFLWTYNYNKITEWSPYKRVTVWAKFYKRTFLISNNIRFSNIRLYGEDVVYTMKCLSKTKNYYINTKSSGYICVEQPDSITHKDQLKIKNDVPKMYKDIDDFIGENKSYLKNNARLVNYYFVKLFTNYLIEQSHYLSKKQLLEYYNESFGLVKELFKKYNYKLRFIVMSKENFSVNLGVNVFMFFEKIKCSKLLISVLNKVYGGKNESN